VQTLKKYTNRAYLVGGACRDFFLGFNIRDIDIEVYDIDVKLFEKIMQDINANGVGKKFFVYKYKNLIDISLARKDNKIQNTHNGFEVAYVNTELEACLRRDFKMNSILINIFNFEILDINNGLRDIQNKQISIINKEKFKEDSLRVLRAIAFSSRLGFRINKKDIEILNNINLSNISNSRVLEEFEKMLNGDYLHFAFYYIVKFDILYKISKIKLTKYSFLKTYRIFKNKTYYFDTKYKKYFFLYILSTHYGLNLHKLYKTNILSRDYKNILKNQIKKPNNIKDIFLYAISIKMPLKNYLGLYDKNIYEKAKQLNIFENKTNIKDITKSILQDGYKGLDFAKELKKRKSLFLRNI
jgi:tRNA nucleotidyltransferase (CCA-adding enzyme)